MGTQLHGKSDEKEWESVRDSEKWEEEGDGILPALKVCYQRPPTHLKRLRGSNFLSYLLKCMILRHHWLKMSFK